MTTPQIADRADHPWYLSVAPIATERWLICLRWTTALIEGAVVAASIVFPHTSFPLRQIALLVLLGAIVNIGLAARLSSAGEVPRTLRFFALLVDVALLTSLVELTGGPFNPFVVTYAIYVTLAIVTLGRGVGGAVWAVALGAYLLLIYWHTTEIEPEHLELSNFPTHLLAMWVTMSAAAELAAYFIAQASQALAIRERALETMRARAARAEHLASLTTLAAGAAHELSTPLATIALAARELEHAVERGIPAPALVNDTRLIRTEVDRCQMILDQMSGRAGGLAADDLDLLDVPAALGEVVARLPGERAMRVQLLAGPLPAVRASKAGFSQAIMSLLSNAFDASPAGGVVIRRA